MSFFRVLIPNTMQMPSEISEDQISEYTVELFERDNNILKNLSFSGGGYKGFAFLGCVKALKERDLMATVQSVAGCSSGSLIAFLTVCGVDFEFMKEAAYGMMKHFETFKVNLFTIIRTLPHGDYGIHRTEDFRKYIKQTVLNAVGCTHDITFGELYDKYPTELIITATCLETQTPFYFSHTTTRDTPISEALAISCSVPFLFGKNTFADKTLVDGGIVERLPMQCWPQSEVDQTMAFLVQSKRETFSSRPLDNVFDYIQYIESSLTTYRDTYYLDVYKNAITIIHAGNIKAFACPSSEEVSKVIYAAYFQTLSELSRRNFIEKESVPKSQEISSTILSNDFLVNLSDKNERYEIIYILICLLLVVTIVKVASC